MKRLSVIFPVVAVALAALVMAYPSPPAWWTTGNTTILDGNTTPNNEALLNLGQLRFVSSQARLYLNETLPDSLGGAGATANSTVDAVTTGGVSGNYGIANLGQLKHVAKPIYDRLLQIGYDTRANLVARGAPSDWPFDYPWDPSTPVELNYAPANLGQLKLVFSFDLSVWASGGNFTTGDADSDGLANYLEIMRGTNPAAADTDGDGANDNADASPLDPHFTALPNFSSSHPNIVLVVPVGASLFSSTP